MFKYFLIKQVKITMFRKIIIVFVSIFFAVFSLAGIQKTDDLSMYTADVTVKDRSSSQWKLGVKEALRRVLVKVSGNASVNTLDDVAKITDGDHLAVQQFSYENMTSVGAGSIHNDELVLKVSFDIPSVNSILQNTGQAIWDTARPQTIIWFVKDKDGKSSFLTDQDEEGRFFLDIAKSRGIQVLFPLQDLQYNALLDVDFSSQDLLEKIRSISSKYGVEQILLGKRVSGSDETYWKLVSGDAEYVWTNSEKDTKMAVGEAVYHVVDGMVARNSFFQDKSMEVSSVMSVDDIDSLEAYQDLVGFLNKCPVVSGFHVESVSSKKVFLVVAAKGGSDAVVDYFNKSKSIGIISDPAAYDEAEIACKWLGK